MFLYLLMILSFFINNIICNKISYEILEETQQNEEIGNILSRIPLNLRRDKLSFVCDSKFFSVSPDGKLVVKKIIDLESLCLTDKLCCGGEFCLLKVGILIKSQEKDIIENLVLDIKVIDRNDHKPKFESETQSVLLSEYSNVGSKVSLKPAVDSDATMKNRIQSYQLIEKTNTFSLDLSKTPSVSLSVVQKLDYEVKKEYEAILKACDQDFCAEQKLIINIKDENDNSPIFSQQTYTFKIKENLKIGDSIGKVEAVDRDSGRLGEVRYSISSDDSDADLRATFLVHTTSGKIFLRRRLSTSTRENYNFRILARDSGPVKSVQAVCNVIVTVIDVNDHAPEITLTTYNDYDTGNVVTGSAGGIKIPENAGRRLMALLKVVDLDKGNNSRVLCWLEPQSDQLFELIKNRKDAIMTIYSLKSRSSFDYEKIQYIDVNMICKDYGNPSLITKLRIPIFITDVNEYYPSFVYPRNSSSNLTNGYYTASIMENSETGTQLIRVKAVDRDGSAMLKYTLDKTGSEYFFINAYTGVIACGNKMLNREKEPHLNFTVFVTDGEKYPKRASAVVKVTVLKAPRKNTPRLKLPDRIIATDQDLGHPNEVDILPKYKYNLSLNTSLECVTYPNEINGSLNISWTVKTWDNKIFKYNNNSLDLDQVNKLSKCNHFTVTCHVQSNVSGIVKLLSKQIQFMITYSNEEIDQRMYSITKEMCGMKIRLKNLEIQNKQMENEMNRKIKDLENKNKMFEDTFDLIFVFLRKFNPSVYSILLTQQKLIAQKKSYKIQVDNFKQKSESIKENKKKIILYTNETYLLGCNVRISLTLKRENDFGWVKYRLFFSYIIVPGRFDIFLESSCKMSCELKSMNKTWGIRIKSTSNEEKVELDSTYIYNYERYIQNGSLIMELNCKE